MKKIVIIISIILIFQKSSYSQYWCIDPNLICDSCGCYLVWDPVCGCDGNIYSNDCFASIAGLTFWYSEDNIMIYGINDICKGDEILLSAFGALSYNWSTGSDSPFIIVSPEITTTYSVTATFDFGCELSKDIIINVNPTYVSSIDTIITSGNSYAVGQNVYNTTGTYYDTLTTIYGCDSIIISNLSVIIDVANFKNGKLKIYPNPTFENLRIESPEKIEKVEIYSSTGILLRQLSINSLETIIKIKEFERNGLKIIKIFTENNIITYKLLSPN